jgi:hypothetical protein
MNRHLGELQLFQQINHINKLLQGQVAVCINSGLQLYLTIKKSQQIFQVFS